MARAMKWKRGVLRHPFGIAGCQDGQTPCFWSLVTDPSHRANMLRDGWKAIGKVFVIALVLDERAAQG